MTQMSWGEVRDTLDAQQKAITQLYGNCEALKAAVDGDVVDGKLLSRRDQFAGVSLWGRLWWLFTGQL